MAKIAVKVAKLYYFCKLYDLKIKSMKLNLVYCAIPALVTLLVPPCWSHDGATQTLKQMKKNLKKLKIYENISLWHCP
jgi:hypothetical protein